MTNLRFFFFIYMCNLFSILFVNVCVVKKYCIAKETKNQYLLLKILKEKCLPRNTQIIAVYVNLLTKKRRSKNHQP